MNLRENAYHSQDTIGEIQHLLELSSNNKEEFEYTNTYLNRKITNLAMKIKSKREALATFLVRNNIDVSAFPAFQKILSDDVYPDTAADQNIGSVDVELMYRKNITDELFDHLKNKIAIKIHLEINDRIDELKKMKLYKAQLEGLWLKTQKAMSDYTSNNTALGDDYKDIRKDLEDLTSLHRGMGEFKGLFSNAPGDFTQDSFAKSQNSNVGGLSSFYAGKKKAIKNQLDKLIENFSDISRYVDAGSNLNQDFFVEKLQMLAAYFGAPGSSSEPSLPAQYVDAYTTRKDIVSKLDNHMLSVTAMIKAIKATLDTIRGSTGLGNHELDTLYADAQEIANSPVNARKVDHVNLDEITDVNKTGLEKLQNKANVFKGVLKNGAAALNDAFIRAQKDLIIKMNIIGFPVEPVTDRKSSLEDLAREKVRKKFGNIPFEDEEEIIDGNGHKIFVKKSELTEVTDINGKKTFIKKSVSQSSSVLNRAINMQ